LGEKDMKCPNCKNPIDDNAMVCEWCGASCATKSANKIIDTTKPTTDVLIEIIQGYRNVYNRIQNVSLFKKMELKIFNKIVGLSIDECLGKMNNIYKMILENKFNFSTDFTFDTRELLEKLKFYYEKSIPLLIYDPKFQKSRNYPTVMKTHSLTLKQIKDIDEILKKY
jgi:hypothetical protein